MRFVAAGPGWRVIIPKRVLLLRRQGEAALITLAMEPAVAAKQLNAVVIDTALLP